VNSEVKEQAGKILASMGLTFSEAFNLMLHQVQIQKALPFEVVSYGHVPKTDTLALIERIENGTAEMAGPFNTFDEYKAWVSSE
jgi:addiction module RelB/DinJ family antitoxin